MRLKVVGGVFTVALVMLLFAGCTERTKRYAILNGFALGTTYHIVVDTSDTTGLQPKMDRLLAEVEASMSIYNPNSLLNRLNRNQTDSVDRHIAYCIEVAHGVSKLSDGAYDVTIRPITQAWGFAGTPSQYRPNIDSLMQYVGYEKISVDNGRLVKQNPNIEIDLNSIAKGYIVDLVGEMILEHGVDNYLVEIGGEVVCRGVNGKGKEWVVGIDKPTDGNLVAGRQLQAMISFTDGGLATSGNYRRYYIDKDGRKVVHTIDARTGESAASNLLSATIIAENATRADALCTMMMAVGLERSKEILDQNPDLMGYLIYADDGGEYKTHITQNLKNKLVR